MINDSLASSLLTLIYFVHSGAWTIENSCINLNSVTKSANNTLTKSLDKLNESIEELERSFNETIDRLGELAEHLNDSNLTAYERYIRQDWFIVTAVIIWGVLPLITIAINKLVEKCCLQM